MSLLTPSLPLPDKHVYVVCPYHTNQIRVALEVCARCDEKRCPIKKEMEGKK